MQDNHINNYHNFVVCVTFIIIYDNLTPVHCKRTQIYRSFITVAARVIIVLRATRVASHNINMNDDFIVLDVIIITRYNQRVVNQKAIIATSCINGGEEGVAYRYFSRHF